VKSRRLGEKGGRNSRKRRGWMGDGFARVIQTEDWRAVSLLLIFQAGEAAVVKLGDAGEGADILGVLLEGCSDFGESLFIVELHHGDLLESLLIILLHGTNDFEGLGEAVQSLIDGAGFGGCVVGHKGRWRLLSSV
jgi:hypothetical protein